MITVEPNQQCRHQVVQTRPLFPRHKVDTPALLPCVVALKVGSEVCFHSIRECLSTAAEVGHVGDAIDLGWKKDAHGIVEAHRPPAVVILTFCGMIVDPRIESRRPVNPCNFVGVNLIEGLLARFESLVELLEESVSDWDAQPAVVSEAASDFVANLSRGASIEGFAACFG